MRAPYDKAPWPILLVSLLVCGGAGCKGGEPQAPALPDGAEQAALETPEATEPLEADVTPQEDVVDTEPDAEGEDDENADGPAPEAAQAEKKTGVKVKTAGGGKAVFSITGCLRSALDGADEKDLEKFAVKVKKGPAAKDHVTVKPAPGGIAVVHELTHACCLKADTKAKVEGKTVEITVALSGTPCRCICSSAIRTNVTLDPGEYAVSVKVTEGGTTRDAGGQTVVVQELKKIGPTAPADEGAVKTLQDKFGKKP
jgi:hypothetical protein